MNAETAGRFDAMIFSAGLGTRLQPFTDTTPKALVEVKGKPLLEYALEAVYKAGIRRVVVNVHHFADKVTRYLSTVNRPGLTILISDESNRLLDTGGGLLNAASWFEAEHIVLYNADILSDLCIAFCCAAHLESKADATLAVSHRDSTRQLLFDRDNRLIGWQHKNKGSYKWCGSTLETPQPFAFQGISVIRREILKKTRLHGIFSLIDLFLETGSGGSVFALPTDSYRWFDIGTPEKLNIAKGSWE